MQLRKKSYLAFITLITLSLFLLFFSTLAKAETIQVGDDWFLSEKEGEWALQNYKAKDNNGLILPDNYSTNEDLASDYGKFLENDFKYIRFHNPENKYKDSRGSEPINSIIYDSTIKDNDYYVYRILTTNSFYWGKISNKPQVEFLIKVPKSNVNKSSDEEVLNLRHNQKTDKSTLLAGDVYKFNKENNVWIGQEDLDNNILKGSNRNETINNFRKKYLLGEASDFDIFLEENLTVHESDAEGRVAVGGTFTSKTGNGKYDIGSGDYLSSTPLGLLLKRKNMATFIVGSLGDTPEYRLSNFYYCYNESHNCRSNNSHPLDGEKSESEKIVVLNKETLNDSDIKNLGYKEYEKAIIQTDQVFLGQIIDFNDSFNYLRNLSNDLSEQKDSFSLNRSGNRLTISYNGTDQYKECIYINLNRDQFDQFKNSNEVYLENIPLLPSPRTDVDNKGGNTEWKYSYIIFNIKDDNTNKEYAFANIGSTSKKIYIKGKADNSPKIIGGEQQYNNEVGATSLLFNFSDATKVILGGNMPGTVFAPNAHVTDYGAGQYGHLSGALIAKSFDGYTEFGYRPFNATIANTLPGSLSITKKVEGDIEVSEFSKHEFKFEIIGPEDCYGETFKVKGAVEETITFSQEGKATITIQGENKAFIYDLPVGNYSVTELSNSKAITNFTCSTTTDPSDGNIEVKENSSSNVTVTNTYSEKIVSLGNLIVEKIVEGLNETESGREYSFTITPEITLGEEVAGKTYQNSEGTNVITFSNKSPYAGTIEVTGGSSQTIVNLPVGTYTVKETNTESDISEYTLEVSSDPLNGNASVSEDSDVKVTITNTYTAVTKETEVNLSAEKTYVNGNLTDQGPFEFVLRQTSGNTVLAQEQTVNNNADGEVNFDAIKFTEIGTYKFEISETPNTVDLANEDGSIVYDTSVYEVTVVVEEDENQLKATVSYALKGSEEGNSQAVEKASFVNTYTAVTKETEVNLSAEKTYVNGNLTDQGPFEFVLRQTAGNTVLAQEQTVKNNADGKINFDAIKFTEVGTYKFEISETPNTVDLGDESGSITYDTSVYEVTVVVEEDGNQLKATISYALKGSEEENSQAVEKAIFVNTYNTSTSDAKETEVNLSAEKTYVNGNLTDQGPFEFVLRQTAGETVLAQEQTVKNNAEGKIDFGAIKFTETGTYKFEISETPNTVDLEDEDGSITYDSSVYEVTVVVEEDDNQLKATVSYTLIGSSQVVDKVSFVNTYNTSSSDTKETEVNLSAKKTYVNGNLTDQGPFEFVLRQTAGNTVLAQEQTVKNNVEGKINFGAIKFTETGTYKFEISEKADTVNLEDKGGSITYDTSVYEVTVVVEDNKNQLKANVSYNLKGTDQSIEIPEFINTYTEKVIEKLATSFNLKKSVVGEGAPVISNGSYSFKISPYSDNPSDDPVKEELILSTKGSNNSYTEIINSGELVYTKEGIYKYKINEVIPTNTVPGITYDSTIQTLVITVTQSKESNKLEAKATLEKGNTTDIFDLEKDTIEFKNTYNAEEIDITIKATKIFENGILNENGPFEFELSPLNQKAQSVLNSVIIAKNKLSEISFGKITFKEAGEYIFKVKELKGNDNTIEYDSSEYLVIVTISKIDGKLTSSIKYQVNNIEKENITFNNKKIVESTDTESPSYGQPSVTISKRQSLTEEFTDQYIQFDESNNIITYELTVTNTSDYTATDIVVTDKIPAGTSLVGDSVYPDATVTNNVIIWKLEELEARESRVLLFTVSVDNGVEQVENTAHLTYKGDAPKDSNKVTAGTSENQQDSTLSPENPSNDNENNSSQDSTLSPGTNNGSNSNNSNNVDQSNSGTVDKTNGNSTNKVDNAAITTDSTNRTNNTTSTTTTSVTTTSPKTGVVVSVGLWITLLGTSTATLAYRRKKNK